MRRENTDYTEGELTGIYRIDRMMRREVRIPFRCCLRSWQMRRRGLRMRTGINSDQSPVISDQSPMTSCQSDESDRSDMSDSPESERGSIAVWTSTGSVERNGSYNGMPGRQ